MADFPDDVAALHPFYSRHQTAWSMIRDAYNGGRDFITSEYIVQHLFEDTESYDKRIERAMYFNIVRRTISQMVRTLVGPGIVRAGFGEIPQLYTDATGYGVPWGTFFEDVGTVAMAYGNAHIFVDNIVSDDSEGIVNMFDADDTASTIPSLTLFTPLQMTNWARTRRKGYAWCIFKTERVIDNQIVDVYIKVDHENVEEVTAQGDRVTEKFAHGLGYTPVIDCPFPAVHRPEMKRGLGEELAYNAKGLLNLTSLGEEIAERAAFNQLTIPDDGAIEEAQARQSDLQFEFPEDFSMGGGGTSGYDPTLYKMHKSRVTTFPAKTGHPPTFISPDSSQLSDVWDMVQSTIKTALYTAGLTTIEGKLDSQELTAILSGMADSLSRAEELSLRVSYAYAGIPVDSEKLVVLYPQAYSTGDFEEWLTNFTIVSGMEGVSEEFRVKLLEGLTLQMPGHSQTQKEALVGALMTSDSGTPSKKDSAGENE